MSAIIVRANLLIRTAKSTNDPELFLIQNMVTKNSPIDLAPVILAYQHITGKVPANTGDMMARAITIAAHALTQITLTPLSGLTEKGLVTDYDFQIPSDAARGHAAELRAKTGQGAYKGPRFQRKPMSHAGTLPHVQLMMDIQR